MKEKKNLIIVALSIICVVLCSVIVIIGFQENGNSKQDAISTTKQNVETDASNIGENSTNNEEITEEKETLFSAPTIQSSTHLTTRPAIPTTTQTTTRPAIPTTTQTTTRPAIPTTTQTTTAAQTTNDETTRSWFIAQYGVAKEQYIDSLEKEVAIKQTQIDSGKSAASNLYVNYMAEVKRIKENYPPSGTRDAMLRNAEQNYNRQATEYTENRKALESDISEIEKEIANPNVDKILAIVVQNCGITSQEAYEYYYLYIA